jgi:hypothetical protein
VSLTSSFEKPPVNHPPVMKSNTVTRFKIISGLRNKLQNHKWLPKGSSQLLSVFIEASQNFVYYFLHNKAAKKFKTIGLIKKVMV